VHIISINYIYIYMFICYDKIGIAIQDKLLPKHVSGYFTNCFKPLTIPDAVARIDFIIISSIRCISDSVSWPIERKCLSNADNVHLCPTSSASGSSLLRYSHKILLCIFLCDNFFILLYIYIYIYILSNFTNFRPHFSFFLPLLFPLFFHSCLFTHCYFANHINCSIFIVRNSKYYLQE